MRNRLAISVFLTLLISLSAHTSSHRAKVLHTRIPHRAVRASLRTDETYFVDHSSGEVHPIEVASFPGYSERPPQQTLLHTAAALPAVPLRLFAAEHFTLLARSGLDPAPLVSFASPASLRGPPAISI